MAKLMRCEYCGLLQDEPAGVKTCPRCGGPLAFEIHPKQSGAEYMSVQMELDQVAAPPGQNVERYLLVTLRSPVEVPEAERAGKAQTRPPVNFCAVLDISGSMGGEKLEQAKQAVRVAAQYLRSGDAFSLVTFNNEVACAIEPLRVGDQTRDVVEALLKPIQASGMTALDGGLELGIAKAKTLPLDTNLVLLLSDGQTNVGEKDLEVIGKRGMQARQEGMLVSCLGIGSDYNEALLAEIATQGGGRFYHVQQAHQIPAYVAGELGEVALLAAKDTRLHLSIPEGATLVPLSAAYPVVQSEGEATVTAGDIPCDTELEIPLRLALVGGAEGSKLSVEGRMTFRSPAGHELEVPLNRVTVRFTAKGQFGLRDGVVAPVVERVLTQLKAASVLGVSRAMAMKPEAAEKQLKISASTVRDYASLLGEERARKEADEMNLNFSTMASSPAAAKFVVSDAFARQRSSKNFNKKP